MLTAIATPRPPASLPAGGYRFNIDEFERIASSLEAERVELIDGIIVERADMDPPHVVASERLRRRLDRLVPDGWFVREDKPLRVDRTYEPFPDLVIVQGDPYTAYLDRHPGPADVAIVIEISGSTLARDRGEKLANCARGGIGIDWVVNLVDRQLEVYADPGPEGYSTNETYVPAQSAPLVIGGVEVGRIAVADILPAESITERKPGDSGVYRG
jgi:Uma2 family endonuclease